MELKVLKFSASWCGPCRALSSTISRMSNLKTPVEEVDIDENPALAKEYGIRGLPTCVLVEPSGAEVSRKVGVMTESEFRKFVGEPV